MWRVSSEYTEFDGIVCNTITMEYCKMAKHIHCIVTVAQYTVNEGEQIAE